jgi:hypothetical protein
MESTPCPVCRQSNRSEARFCRACGATLVTTCRQCGARNRSQARFCIRCGVRMGSAQEAAIALVEPSATPKQDVPATAPRSAPLRVLEASA